MLGSIASHNNTFFVWFDARKLDSYIVRGHEFDSCIPETLRGQDVCGVVSGLLEVKFYRLCQDTKYETIQAHIVGMNDHVRLKTIYQHVELK